MTNKPQAVLFDLDGTLLDTALDFTFCMNEILKEENKAPVSLELLKDCISFGSARMIAESFNLSEDSPQFVHLRQRMLNLYQITLGDKTTFFEGIPALIKALEENTIPWGIVTNKPHVYTVPLVKRFSPLDKAQCIISGDSLPTSKPNPQTLLHACQLLKVNPTECWYVGDAKTDYEASVRAGMRSMIATYGYIPRGQNPMDWQAHHYVKTPHEIISFFNLS